MANEKQNKTTRNGRLPTPEAYYPFETKAQRSSFGPLMELFGSAAVLA